MQRAVQRYDGRWGNGGGKFFVVHYTEGLLHAHKLIIKGKVVL